MEWICDAIKGQGLESLSFDQWMEYASFFFCHRHDDEGLKYIF
jgi:hypothetical protein